MDKQGAVESVGGSKAEKSLEGRKNYLQDC
jgi:hypothetical protein